MGKRFVLMGIFWGTTSLASPIHIDMCYRIFGQKECVKIYQKKKRQFIYRMEAGGSVQSRKISAQEAKKYKFAIRRFSQNTYGRGHGKCKEAVIWQEKDAQKVTICVSNQSPQKKIRLRSLLSQIIH